MASAQKILVFDSGLGGLTVLAAILALRPDVDTLYVADDARFPYGALTPEALVARVQQVLAPMIADFSPDAVVIACHTASTLVLPELRARYAMPIIGTVPAIKPAAEATRSGPISVLATEGTVRRDYTHELIRDFAANVAVTLHGASRLAGLAEAKLHGRAVADAELLAEIAPAFIECGDRRTDTIVLACTHYPLILAELQRLAPWTARFIDPAPAIARRLVQLLGPAGGGEGQARARFTAGVPQDTRFLDRFLNRPIEVERCDIETRIDTRRMMG